MKILLSMMSLTKGKGGAERVATELANEMHRRGHELIMYSSSSTDEKPQYPLAEGIHHIQIPLAKTNEVRETLLAVNPDVFFIFYSTSHLLDQYAIFAHTSTPIGAQECTNPIRVIENFARRKNLPDLKTAFAMRNALLAGMHGIRFTMDSYINYLPKIAKPSCRTYNNTFRPASEKADIRKTTGRKRIISVGGLKAKNKNGVVLAKAFAELAMEFPDWDVYFFGANNLPEAKEIASKNNLQERIILAGNSDNIYAEYAKSQIHVITSFEEGCPNVVCEAMLHGIPSIGYADCPGTNELIVDMKNGLLISRENEVENLAHALRRLMSDEELREKLGQESYIEASARFDSTKIYDRWENLFRHIAGYKNNPQRLFAEQEAIDADAAQHQQRLRSLFMLEFSSDYLADTRNINNEKVRFPSTSKVSIILDGEGDIEPEKLDALKKALSYTPYLEWELLISSNVTPVKENTQEIRFLSATKEETDSAQLNRSLENAAGEYVLFLKPDSMHKLPMSLPDIIRRMEIHCSDIAFEQETSPMIILKQANKIPPPLHRGMRIYSRSFLEKWKLRFNESWYDLHDVFFLLARLVTVESLKIRGISQLDALQNTPLDFEELKKIEEISKGFLAERNIQHAEGQRQLLILEHFVLDTVRKICDPWNEGITSAIIVKNYRLFVRNYKEGILALAESNPPYAAALIAFASGKDEEAHHILTTGKLENPITVHRNNPFNFSESELEILTKSNRPTSLPKNHLKTIHRNLGRFLYGTYLLMPYSAQKNLHKIKLLKQIKEKLTG